MIDRVLQFNGIHNFRDYGGYATASGGRLKSATLYRSGQHRDATPDDLIRVAALDLRTIIDLRGNSERASYPCARAEGFAATVLFYDGETAGRGGAPHVEAARPEIATAGDAHAVMIDLYAFMPFRPNLIAVLRMYFDTLEQRDGATLLHCFAGKDRTGLAAALLHRLLGVHYDDMMADYMLTNTAGDAEARIAAGAESIRKSRGAGISDAAVRTLMNVDPAYLNAAFAAIHDAHGSIASYAETVLGVTPARVARIAARLID
jgi:protein-tyrosine phosphatase